MFKLVFPAHGDLVVDGEGRAFRVNQIGLGLNCEGCGGRADVSLVPTFESDVPVSTVSYCFMDLATTVSDPDTPDTLFKPVR